MTPIENHSLIPPGVNPRKRRLAHWLSRRGALEALLRAQTRWYGPHLRALNYHSVPSIQAASFERQLQWFKRHFVPVGYKELRELHEGRWRHDRPGLLMSFDDGCRSHAEVVAPLLERHGFTGWFFVPSGFPDVPETQQLEYALAHDISASSDDGPRLSLSWEQVRHLDRHHVVGCHTLDHVRLAADRGESVLRRQIEGGKSRLEAELGHEVRSFSWVGGEEWGYSAPAAKLIGEAGFEIVFGTNNCVFRPGEDLRRIERTNVEASYEPELLQFQLCGVLDLRYLPKRRRLRRLLRY